MDADRVRAAGHAGSCSVWVQSRLGYVAQFDLGRVFSCLIFSSSKGVFKMRQNEVNRGLFCIMDDTHAYSPWLVRALLFACVHV